MTAALCLEAMSDAGPNHRWTVKNHFKFMEDFSEKDFWLMRQIVKDDA